jgi:hypothetical protein
MGSLRRRIGVLLAGVAVGLGLMVTPAAASTSSSIGVAAATSYGFYCSSTYNWLHQNWPNISVDRQHNRRVYVRALLYRWNGHKWKHVRTSNWYVGVSNVTGHKILGYDAGGLPYYFARAGHPSRVPSNTGYAFKHLRNNRFYTTREQYQALGYRWKAWNAIQGESTPGYCTT